MDILQKLSEALNKRRQETGLIGSQEWSRWTVEKWLNKLSEEVGELCQCYNKDTDKQSKEEEIADVIMVAIVIANQEKIDLEQALINKFNKTSVKRGSKIKIGH